MEKINQHIAIQVFKVSKSQAASLPELAGVYFFLNEHKKPIYIGKANNLRSRVRSYFLSNLAEKTNQMVNEAKYLSHIVIGSELESLLLEAELIKKYKPHYNSALKDDKHPIYIAITDDEFSLVLTVRKPEIEKKKFKRVFGPFPASRKAKEVLKILRRIFPFSQHHPRKRVCLYHQMGLCDPCPSQITNEKNVRVRKELTRAYRNNVKYVRLLLAGRIKYVRNNIVKKMNQFSKLEMFEEAKILRDKVKMIDYITRPIIPVEKFLENPNLKEDLRAAELIGLKKLISTYFKFKSDLVRIECFDVAHLAGASPSASMVTFVGGDPEKKYYRHFSIRQTKTQSDTDSLKEVIERRLKHLDDWGVPDLIIVDGGKAQVSAFRKAFAGQKIPVVGFAKRHETLVIPIKVKKLSTNSFKEIRLRSGPAKNLIVRLRNEAHRFARRHHHHMLKKSLLHS